MRTSKPVSAISYNTEAFLAAEIMRWRDEGLIEFGTFVFHEPEEGDLKRHAHVWVKPAKTIQTTDLENRTKEIDLTNPLNPPLKTMLWRKSEKFYNWYMYTTHDTAYGLKHGYTEARKYQYGPEDYLSTDADAFELLVSEAKEAAACEDSTMRIIIEMIQSGLQFHEILRSGAVPLKQVHNAKLTYEALSPYVKPSKPPEPAVENAGEFQRVGGSAETDALSVFDLPPRVLPPDWKA